MEINMLELSIVQAKINRGEKPEKYSNRLAYLFSQYNSMFLSKRINNLSMELV